MLTPRASAVLRSSSESWFSDKKSDGQHAEKIKNIDFEKSFQKTIAKLKQNGLCSVVDLAEITERAWTDMNLPASLLTYVASDAARFGTKDAALRATAPALCCPPKFAFRSDAPEFHVEAAKECEVRGDCSVAMEGAEQPCGSHQDSSGRTVERRLGDRASFRATESGLRAAAEVPKFALNSNAPEFHFEAFETQDCGVLCDGSVATEGAAQASGPRQESPGRTFERPLVGAGASFRAAKFDVHTAAKESGCPPKFTFRSNAAEFHFEAVEARTCEVLGDGSVASEGVAQPSGSLRAPKSALRAAAKEFCSPSKSALNSSAPEFHFEVAEARACDVRGEGSVPTGSDAKPFVSRNDSAQFFTSPGRAFQQSLDGGEVLSSALNTDVRAAASSAHERHHDQDQSSASEVWDDLHHKWAPARLLSQGPTGALAEITPEGWDLPRKPQPKWFPWNMIRKAISHRSIDASTCNERCISAPQCFLGDWIENCGHHVQVVYQCNVNDKIGSYTAVFRKQGHRDVLRTFRLRQVEDTWVCGNGAFSSSESHEDALVWIREVAHGTHKSIWNRLQRATGLSASDEHPSEVNNSESQSAAELRHNAAINMRNKNPETADNLLSAIAASISNSAVAPLHGMLPFQHRQSEGEIVQWRYSHNAKKVQAILTVLPTCSTILGDWHDDKESAKQDAETKAINHLRERSSRNNDEMFSPLKSAPTAFGGSEQAATKSKDDSSNKKVPWSKSNSVLDEIVNDCCERELEAGQCLVYEDILHIAGSKLGRKLGQSDVGWDSRLAHILRLEGALRQFLQTYRAHTSVWSVCDMEAAFLRSNLCKKEWDVCEWRSLRIGPCLAKHKILHDVFPELVPGADCEEHITASDALRHLLRYRYEFGYTNVVELRSFQAWLLEEFGWSLESRGCAFSPDRFALIIGSQNAAMTEQKRLLAETREQHLAHLVSSTAHEVHNELTTMRDASSEFSSLARSFLTRCRRAVQAAEFEEAFADVLLWVRYVFNDDMSPAISKLIGVIVLMLQEENKDDRYLAAKNQDPQFRASPFELAEAALQHFHSLPREANVDVHGLLAAEEAITGRATSIDALLPGTSFLNLVAQHPALCELVNHRLGVAVTPAARSHNTFSQQQLVEEILRELQGVDVFAASIQCAVLDVKILAEIEQSMYRRLGSDVLADWAGHGSMCALLASDAGAQVRRAGWALCSKDCQAFDYWIYQVACLVKSGGPPAVTSHFGADLLAVGMPPAHVDPLESTSLLGADGLHYEAVVLGKAGQRKHTTTQDVGILHVFIDIDQQITEVLDAIAISPLLADLEDALLWEEKYRCTFGPFLKFIHEQARIGTLSDRGLSLLVTAPASLPSACISPRVFRLPGGACPEDLECAIRDGKEHTAAATLLALFIQDPLDTAPLRYHVGQGLNQLSEKISCGFVRTAFCIALLVELPVATSEVVGKQVLLDLMQCESRWAQDAIDVSQRLGFSSHLARLGYAWGVHEWIALKAESRARSMRPSSFATALGTDPNSSTSSAALQTVACSIMSVEPTSTQLQQADEASTTNTELGLACESVCGKGECMKPETMPDKDDLVSFQKIIQCIRDGFLLENADALQLQENLGGSLARLACDLYHEQHHFIFELLQNADDSRYSDGTVPAFKLVLEPDVLIALSNEVGFTEQDVRALCSVDKSTKPHLKEGGERIGRKGIGFKSVFKISDSPRIHSGGWHFGFNAQLPSYWGSNLKGLGYIVPDLLPESNKRHENWHTEIQLPFHLRFSESERMNMRKDLEHLDGVLLLNMNRLRVLHIEDMTSKPSSIRTMRCEPICDSLTRLLDGDVVRDWISIRWSAPFSSNKSRPIQLSLSFQCPTETTTAEWLEGHRPSIPTCCYLPLRHYGWRILLHANFDVTASRTELHNSAWNAKIKSHLPDVFVQAASTIKDNFMPAIPNELGQPAQMSRDALTMTAPIADSRLPKVRCVPYSFLLHFLPLPGMLGYGDSDYFRGVENKLWERFRKEPCVLAANGEWVEPHRVIKAPYAMLTAVPASLLAQFHDGLLYLHSEFVGITPQIALLLGLRDERAAFDVLVEVLRKMGLTGDLQICKPESIVPMLEFAYRLVFGEFGRVEETCFVDAKDLAKLFSERLDILGKLAILPVSGKNMLVAATDANVFLPGTDGDEKLNDTVNQMASSLSLHVIDHTILQGSQGTRRLLQRCGAFEVTAAGIMVNGILAFLETRLEEDPDPPQIQTLICCIQFLAGHQDQFQDCDACSKRHGKKLFTQSLRASLRIPCRMGNQGQLCCRSVGEPFGQFVLSCETHELFACSPSLRPELREAHRILSHCIPLEDAWCVDTAVFTGNADIEQVAVFLEEMGLNRTFFPVERCLCNVREFRKDGTLQAHEKIFDFMSSSLDRLLAKGPDAGTFQAIVASSVLGLQQALWCSTDGHGHGHADVPSTIAGTLRQASWVLCEGGMFRSPLDTYFATESVSSYLRKEFSFLDTDSIEPALRPRLTGFLEELGSGDLEAKHVLNLLREWSSVERPLLSEGQLVEIYTFLHVEEDRTGSTTVYSAFRVNHERLIFVPREPSRSKTDIDGPRRKQTQDNNVMDGIWLQAQECCIRLVPPLLPRRLQSPMQQEEQDRLSLSHMSGSSTIVRELELHYGAEMKEPFQKFGVPEYPSLARLCRCIEAANSHWPFEDVLTQVAKILRWLRRSGHLRQEEHAEFRKCLAIYRALPTCFGDCVAWRMPTSTSDTALAQDTQCATEVYLPNLPRDAGCRRRDVLHGSLCSTFDIFTDLGMTEISLAEVTSDVPNVVVNTQGPVDSQKDTSDLRISLAYVQCWLYLLHRNIHDYCHTKVEHLQSMEFRIWHHLEIDGQRSLAYEAGRIINILQDDTGAGCDEALRNVLISPSLLDLKTHGAHIFRDASSVAFEVLDRLRQAQSPGRAARLVLARFGVKNDDLSILALQYWFRSSILPLEEPLPSLVKVPAQNPSFGSSSIDIPHLPSQVNTVAQMENAAEHTPVWQEDEQNGLYGYNHATSDMFAEPSAEIGMDPREIASLDTKMHTGSEVVSGEQSSNMEDPWAGKASTSTTSPVHIPQEDPWASWTGSAPSSTPMPVHDSQQDPWASWTGSAPSPTPAPVHVVQEDPWASWTGRAPSSTPVPNARLGSDKARHCEPSGLVGDLTSARSAGCTPREDSKRLTAISTCVYDLQQCVDTLLIEHGPADYQKHAEVLKHHIRRVVGAVKVASTPANDFELGHYDSSWHHGTASGLIQDRVHPATSCQSVQTAFDQNSSVSMEKHFVGTSRVDANPRGYRCELEHVIPVLRRVYWEHGGPDILETKQVQHVQVYETSLPVSSIYFTHSEISDHFHNGEHAGESIEQLIEDLVTGSVKPRDLRLVCVSLNGKVYVLFNRRLAALKEYSRIELELGHPEVIVPVLVSEADPLTAKFVMAFSSQCDGESVEIRQRHS